LPPSCNIFFLFCYQEKMFEVFPNARLKVQFYNNISMNHSIRENRMGLYHDF
jgi:hypothetical protein